MPVASGLGLLEAARRSVRAGRLVAGRALLAAARAAGAADDDRCDELDGRLLLEERRYDDARTRLAAAAQRSPGDWRLRCLNAEARLLSLDAAGAAAEAAEAVVLAPREIGPKAMLGSALLLLGRADGACACLGEAVAGNRLHVGHRLALASALASRGDAEAAEATLLEGIGLRPLAPELRVAAIRMAVAARAFDRAVALADAACEDGVSDACVFGLRGHALSCLGRDDEALIAYAEALRMAPEDPYVRHLVASGGLAAQPSRASADYVRVVFDGFAGRFESDLIRLGYRVPGLVRSEIIAHANLPTPPGRLGPVLDLGCGTGFVAVALSDLAVGPFIGIDLSPNMLREAAAKNLYAELIEDDICAGLRRPGRFAIVVAADVMPYLGDPAPVLAETRARLLPGGLFILTAETLDEDDAAAFRLGRRARFAHRPSALLAAAVACGFQVVRCQSEDLRIDRGEPVRGCVLVLRRSAEA